MGPWLGLASEPAGTRHIKVLAGQGETWPRSLMPRRGAKSWADPCHDCTGVGCRRRAGCRAAVPTAVPPRIARGTLSAGLCPLGRDSLEQARWLCRRQIIMLVSDINMPGMSGLDLLPKVKERRPWLPVFMISAYGGADTVATALARGADEFLTKPVDFPKLKQDIMAVMPDSMGGTDDRATNRRDY